MMLRSALGALGFAVVGLIACGGPSASSPTESAGTGGTTLAAGGSTSGGSGGGLSGASGSASVAGAGGAAAGGSGAGTAGTGTSGTSTGGGAGGVTGAAGGGGATGGGGGTGGGAGGTGDLPPLEECNGKPSIDRITSWTATNGECVCTPVGNIMTTEGSDAVAKVVFMGSDWHVVPVLITNQFGKTADLSAAPGVQLIYSASAALHVQLRSGSHWSGGDQYAADMPSTSGMKQTLFIPFDASKWASLFGTPPPQSFADVLKEVQGLVFVGQGANSVTFYGLRLQGFTPTCP